MKTNREIFLSLAVKKFPHAGISCLARTNDLDSEQLVSMFGEIQRVYGELFEDEIRDFMIDFDDNCQIQRGFKPQEILPGTMMYNWISCFATVFKQRIG